MLYFKSLVIWVIITDIAFGSAVEELFNALKLKASASKIPNSTSTKTAAALTKPQKVSITMSYPKVIAVDDKAQTITTTFELRLEWIDPTMSWNPSQYHGIDHILFPADLLFIPDVTLTNSAKLNLPSISINRYVKINSTGKISQSTMMVATTVCDLHLDDFPFDNQTCSLDFNSFLLNNKEQTFDPQIIADYNYDMGNSEFKVISLYAYIQLYDQANEQFEMASFVFLIQRNADFYVFVLIFPMYFSNVFLVFGLFQPVTIYDKHKPDKLSIATACFISFVIIGSILSSKINFSTSKPTIVIYYFLQICFCLLSLILSLTSPFIYWKLNCAEHSHPDPMDVPSPRDEFSLESERRIYEEHLDRMKKRSSAAVDSCMVELRVALSNINEVLQSKTEAKWRRRLWQTAYGRMELGMFTGLQLLNFIGLSIMLHLWQ